jgi:hypothetical protein
MSDAPVEMGDARRRRRGFWAWAAGAGFAGWWLASAASQHPLTAFDRLRRYDRLALLPNWRFFAPEPAQHDYRVLHRVLTADGGQTAWGATSHITPRSDLHIVWFPGRRREKAVFDVCGVLLERVETGAAAADLPAYHMLREFVEVAVRREYRDRPLPQGYQFLIARHAGYDEEPDPDYLFLSPFIPLGEDAAP